jgi:hypothetical protein
MMILLKSFTVLCFGIFITGCMELFGCFAAISFLLNEDLWKRLQETEEPFLK